MIARAHQDQEERPQEPKPDPQVHFLRVPGPERARRQQLPAEGTGEAQRAAHGVLPGWEAKPPLSLYRRPPLSQAGGQKPMLPQCLTPLAECKGCSIIRLGLWKALQPYLVMSRPY